MISIYQLAAGALVALTLQGAADATKPPNLKEGIWLVHTESVSQPEGSKVTTTSSLCRSHAYDEYIRQLATKLTDNMRDCTHKERVQGMTYSAETRCVVAGIVVDSQSTTTYRPDSTHSESRQTYTPPLEGVSQTSVVEDQTYEGSCPVGAHPGDVTLADGTELHLWKH